MSVAIIDYESGNLHSAAKAFQRAADGLNMPVEIVRDPEALRLASHIVLPGVGAYNDCMAGLRRIDGMIDALNETVLQKGTWFLGICVGMQLMLERGLEHGEHAGLGWIKGSVVPIQDSGSGGEPRGQLQGAQEARPSPEPTPNGRAGGEPRGQLNNHRLKIPHMGWNELQLTSPAHPLFRQIENGDHVYFVHSYYADCTNAAEVLASVEYGRPLSACVGRDNLLGTQFHPEKSQRVGLQLIENFLRL